MSILETRQTSKKFLDVRINLAGAWKMNYNYEAVKNEPDYETKYKNTFPIASKFVGTIDGTSADEFVPTDSPGWTVDELKDKYAIFFVEEDVTDVVTAKKLNDIAKLPFTIQKIVSNTATAITVGQDINVGSTAVIVIGDPWIKFNQLQDYTFNDSANQLPANDADSGGYVINIDGLRTADITGISGNYYIGLATHFQTVACKETGTEFYVRLGASKNLHETVRCMKVSATEFEPQGTIEGDSVATFGGTLSFRELVGIENIVVDGEIPTFI